MAILHTINKSPFRCSTASNCLRVCSAIDSVIFIEDGVLNALTSAPTAEEVIKLSEAGTRFYALHVDVQARGLTNMILQQIQLISYSDFVQISIRCKQIQSWY